MASAPPLPELFTYLDYRSYLADWFEAKKARNSRFSHRMFARLAGQRSSSLLAQVISGDRNLTPANVSAFAQAMKLDEDQSRYFACLVDLDQEASEERRNAAWAHISATRRFRDAHLISDHGFDYLSSWYLPAIRELAARADFREDPAWIAERLRPQVASEQVRQAVDTLLSLGLLRRGDDGRLEQAEATVVTPHEVRGLAVHNYHRGMLQLAIAAITDTRPAERHMGALTVGVPRSLVPQIKQEICDFQQRLLDLCDSAEEPTERVYQVQLSLFPLSDRGPDA